MLATLAVAGLVDIVGRVVVTRIFAATRSRLDDRLWTLLRRPISISVLLAGAVLLIGDLPVGSAGLAVVSGLIATTAILMWSVTLIRVAGVTIEEAQTDAGVVQPSTRPLFDIGGRVVIVGAAAYFLMLAWGIDPTAWLASAGIVGMAVGFAAKDTVANLFAGFFIMTDRPYKLGDFLVVDGTERGKVTRIGIRTTRILTMDDVEVVIPNAIMANTKVVNETGGPHSHFRVGVPVTVAYGSDPDEVERVLLRSAEGADRVVWSIPELLPRVRFREMGESGLKFELLVWAKEPEFRGVVVSALNRSVYLSLRAAGIEIPYNKLDLYIKESPVRR